MVHALCVVYSEYNPTYTELQGRLKITLSKVRNQMILSLKEPHQATVVDI